MLNQKNDDMLATYGTLVGRVLLGLLFFVSGINIILGDPAQTAEYYASVGVPMAGIVVWLVIVLKIGASAMLFVGYHVRYAALALILFVLAASALAHLDFTDKQQVTALLKNLSIVGGLLYVMAYGAGSGWRMDRSPATNEHPGTSPGNPMDTGTTPNL